MKRLLSPKVLHPRPQRPVHQPSHLSSPAGVSRTYGSASSVAPAVYPTTSAARSIPTGAEPPVLALADHTQEHERDLEHSFFAAGLSEDSLRAISERQREQIERELPAGRAQKVVFGFAMCAGLLLVSGFVGTKVIGGARGFGARPGTPSLVVPPPAPIPPAPAEPAPLPAAVLAAPAPVAAVVFGPELPPASEDDAAGPAEAAVTMAAPVRTVDVTGLRARAVAELQAVSAEATTAEPDQAPAEAEQLTAEAAAAPATDDPREACGEQLRRGEFRNIKQSCSVAFEAQPDAQLATEVARAALDDKRNREAAAWARKAIAVDASFADAFVYLGAAENQLGHSQAAREAYGRYLQLEPQGDQAENVRAIIENL